MIRKWCQVQKLRKTGPQKHHHDDSREQKEHIPFKTQHLTTEELENTIKDKIQKSTESITKLKKPIENNTCPKTLRYNARANIAPDEEFKRDISWIRKDAERKVLGALVKFHDRRVERSKSKLVKLEQESRKEKRKDMSDKVPSNTLECSHEQKLENIQKKIDELNKMKYILQNAKENKQSESYPRVFSENIDYLKRERGKKKRSLSTKKRNERRRKIARDLDKNITEARKKHIKNLSDYKMTRDQINVLSRGLKFIPTPVTNTGHVRAELLKDFNAFARRMRLQYIFHGKDKEQHPFHVKSDWEPPVQPSVALETYLEEVKLQLANINTITPRNNLPKREQLAIKQLKQNPDINIKRADKGSSIVVLNKEDKIKDGQI